jgi:triacylglycerol lipase
MFPIVLAHGVARFDILRQLVHDELNLPPNPLEDELQYFKNVRTFLNQNGFSQVSNSNVEFAGSLETRAAELKNDVESVLAQTGAEKAHIIAHSMGGLDARMMIVDLGMADRVASLTTIGTPHLGTVLANRVLGFGGRLLIKALQDAIKLDLDGFKDLTTATCDAFNRRARDDEAKNDVVYQVFSSYEEGAQMFLPLFGSWALIRSIEGRNDGLVSVRSQMWESELIASDGTQKQVIQREFPFRADHLNQTGWWDLNETLDGQIGGNPLQENLITSDKSEMFIWK